MITPPHLLAALEAIVAPLKLFIHNWNFGNIELAHDP